MSAAVPRARSRLRHWPPLIAEILVAYVRARLVMRDGDVGPPVRRRRAAALARRPPDVPLHEGEHLGRAVTRTLSVLPTDSRCLVRSLVLVDLLSARGLQGRLVIGARPQPEFAAHAWVELDGVPLLPPGEYGDKRLTEI